MGALRLTGMTALAADIGNSGHVAFLELRQRPSGAQQRAVKRRGKHLVKPGQCEFLEGHLAAFENVVDQNIETAESRHGGIDHRARNVRLRDVAHMDDARELSGSTSRAVCSASAQEVRALIRASAPPASRSRAIARPMFLALPVTTAARPFSSEGVLGMAKASYPG